MKKGFSQIDWIISLSLFLIYLAWFFSIVMPSVSFEKNKNSIMNLLKTNFEKEFMVEIKKIPLFIYHNKTNNLPIIINFTLNSSIKFEDNTPFIIKNNRLVFLANKTKKYYYLIMGKFEQDNYYDEILYEDDWVSTENMSIYFSRSLVKKVYYDGEKKVKSAAYYFNGELFLPNSSVNNSGFVVSLDSHTSTINHTTLVFAHNPRIYSIILTPFDYKFVLELSLHNYKKYYSNNLYFGNISYKNTTRSFNYTADRLTLYEEDSLTLFFSKNVSINLTYYNTTLLLALEADVDNEFEYWFIFSKSNVSDVVRDEYTYEFGFVEKEKGVNLSSIVTNYTYLRELWNFPDSSEFSIKIYENTTKYRYNYQPLFVINPSTPSSLSYSEDVNYFSINELGAKEKININYVIWEKSK